MTASLAVNGVVTMITVPSIRTCGRTVFDPLDHTHRPPLDRAALLKDAIAPMRTASSLGFFVSKIITILVQ